MATRPESQTNEAVPTPAELRRAFSIGARARQRIAATRADIGDIVRGETDRLLVVVGPCSIHDLSSARDYAHRLGRLQRQHERELLVVMRSYFEKPRTTVGWKGLLGNPRLDGSNDLAEGLRRARQLLTELAELDMPTAVEALDPLAQPYLSDLVSWTAIGARTTESQTHRELASGLGMPVGFKNGTDGSVDIAMHAMRAAASPHASLGMNDDGGVAVVRTAGNRNTHVVLRGDKSGPNYMRARVAELSEKLAAAGLSPRLMIDCSHDNSLRDHQKQQGVVEDVAAQLAEGSDSILGVMIESHLVAGRQELTQLPLVYGQSITDACVDFATTEHMLQTLAAAVKGRRQAVRAHYLPMPAMEASV